MAVIYSHPEFSIESSDIGAIVAFGDGRQNRMATPIEVALAEELAAAHHVVVALAEELAAAHYVAADEIMAEPQAATAVNINTADIDTLIALPSIGQKTAEKIVELRPFADMDDFRDRLHEAGKKPQIDELTDLITF